MRTSSIVSLSLVLLLGACSDNTEKKACPAGGIGVTSSNGVKCEGILDPNNADLLDCQQQIETYKEYGCSKPQVCFDNGSLLSYGKLVSKEQPALPLSFILTNCSTGNQKLVIQKVEVMGDERCYLNFDASQDIEKMEIPSGEGGLIQVRYDPKKTGEDHAVVVVHTNAENFPVLRLYVCGVAISRYLPNMDSGAPPDLSPSADDAGRPLFLCKDQTKAYPCHQQ